MEGPNERKLGSADRAAGLDVPTEPAGNAAADHRVGNPSRSLVRLVLGLIAAVTVLVAVAFAVLIASVATLRSENRRVQRSEDVLATSLSVERSVVDLETGVRGYLITGQDSFLTPYSLAERQLPRQSSELRLLTQGSASEQAQLEGLEAAIDRYETSYLGPLVGSATHLSRAQAVQQTLAGKSLLDALRDRFAAFDRDRPGGRGQQPGLGRQRHDSDHRPVRRRDWPCRCCC